MATEKFNEKVNGDAQQARGLLNKLHSDASRDFYDYGCENLALGQMVLEMVPVFKAMIAPLRQISMNPEGMDEFFLKRLNLRGFERESLRFDWQELGLTKAEKNELINSINEVGRKEKQIVGMIDPWQNTTLMEKDRDLALQGMPGYKPIRFNDSKTPDDILNGVPKQICLTVSVQSKEAILNAWEKITDYAERTYVHEDVLDAMRKFGALSKEIINQNHEISPVPKTKGFTPSVINGGKSSL